MTNRPTASLRAMDIAGIAVLGALTLALFFLFIQPLSGAYIDFTTQRTELENRKQSAVTTAAALSTARGRLAAAQKQLANTPLQLQSARLINARLAELTDLGTKIGLRIEDVQPGKTVVSPRYETVPIHLAGTGPYRACIQFLHKLRQTCPDISVSSFKLTGSPDSPDATARYTLELEWFCTPSQTASAR